MADLDGRGMAVPDTEVAAAVSAIVDRPPGAVARLAPQAWYIVVLLCLMFVFSFVDRLILGLLAPSIGADLKITDTQLGLLIGTSFAVVYSTVGLPMAHFLDRANRKRILVCGILLWSVATLASGFATNFAMLAVLRAGVAIGESVLSPAAVSLIADLFPRDRRVLPMSVYASMSALMGVGGLIVGAAALQFAEHVSGSVGLAPWRLVLVLVGALPLLLGLVFAVSVREPQRDRFDAVDPTTPIVPADAREFLAFLSRNKGFFIPFYTASAFSVIYLFGIMTWTPTLMIRGHGIATANAGYLFGIVGMACGFLGAIAWPRLVVLSARRGWREPILLCLTISCVFGAPFMIFAPLFSHTPLFLAGMGVAVFAGTGIAALMPLAIQAYGPPRLRARLMALVLLSQSLIGYGAGPPLVASLAKRWPGNPLAFGHALAVTGVVVVPAAALCYFLARRALMRRGLA